jgi:hypothetical protein
MGFDGVLLSEPVMGDLENTIHPVFAPDHWPLEDFTSNPNSDLWVALKPALRLASHMLTSKAALAFFRRLRFGVETVNEETHETYLDYEDPSAPVQEEQEKMVLRDLQDISKRIKFLFAAHKPEEGEGLVHAITMMSQERFGKRLFVRGGDLSQMPDESSGYLYTALHPAYKAYATSTIFGKYSACQYARFAFSLASTVVHETAHAYYAHHTQADHEEWNEPLVDLMQFDEDGLGELGCALETALFKDLITSTIHPRNGVTLQSGPTYKELVGKSVVSISSSLIFPVDPRWLHSLLTTDFWNSVSQMSDKEQLRALYIPRVEEGICLTMDKHRHEEWGWREVVLDAHKAKEQLKAKRTKAARKEKDRKLKPGNLKGKERKKLKLEVTAICEPELECIYSIPVIEHYEAYDQKALEDALMKKWAELKASKNKDESGT